MGVADSLIELPLGSPAPDFALPGVDGKTHSLQSYNDRKILVVMFTCNHCPYVQANERRLIEIQRDYAAQGVQLVAINANETEHYPEDRFEEMQKRAKQIGYNFPYLRDGTQKVADAYKATHTPHVMVFDQERHLRYAGRVDDNWKEPAQVKSPDLRNALEDLLAGQAVRVPQTFAVGCTIKWRT